MQIYTAEQQARLCVDEVGRPALVGCTPAASGGGGVGGGGLSGGTYAAIVMGGLVVLGLVAVAYVTLHKDNANATPEHRGMEGWQPRAAGGMDNRQYGVGSGVRISNPAYETLKSKKKSAPQHGGGGGGGGRSSEGFVEGRSERGKEEHVVVYNSNALVTYATAAGEADSAQGAATYSIPLAKDQRTGGGGGRKALTLPADKIGGGGAAARAASAGTSGEGDSSDNNVLYRPIYASAGSAGGGGGSVKRGNPQSVYEEDV